jgi:hypothetical protein
MKCANPLCGFESLYFRSGSLHYIDSEEGILGNRADAQRKLIWLCPECTELWSVQTWRPPGEQLRLRDLLTKDRTGGGSPRIHAGEGALERSGKEP